MSWFNDSSFHASDVGLEACGSTKSSISSCNLLVHGAHLLFTLVVYCSVHHATCWLTVLIYYSHLLFTVFIMQPVGSQYLFIIHTCFPLFCSSYHLLIHSIESLFTLVVSCSVHCATCWFAVFSHDSHLLSSALFIMQPVGSQYLLIMRTCCSPLCSSCNVCRRRC